MTRTCGPPPGPAAVMMSALPSPLTSPAATRTPPANWTPYAMKLCSSIGGASTGGTVCVCESPSVAGSVGLVVVSPASVVVVSVAGAVGSVVSTGGGGVRIVTGGTTQAPLNTSTCG